MFGELNYNMTDEWRLNFGLRWKDEDVCNSFAGDGALDGGWFDLSGGRVTRLAASASITRCVRG